MKIKKYGTRLKSFWTGKVLDWHEVSRVFSEINSDNTVRNIKVYSFTSATEPNTNLL